MTTTQDPETDQQLAVLKTKLPERTRALIDDILHTQGTTIYEYLQQCCAMVLTYAHSDRAWVKTADALKHPLLQHLYILLDEAAQNKEFVRTFRSLEGMQDITGHTLEERIESVTITFRGGQTATMQQPGGLLAEMSYSANDALDTVIYHIAPLASILEQLQAIYGPDRSTAEILHTALADHLEDMQHAANLPHIAQNEYGVVPVRHNNRSTKY